MAATSGIRRIRIRRTAHRHMTLAPKMPEGWDPGIPIVLRKDERRGHADQGTIGALCATPCEGPAMLNKPRTVPTTWLRKEPGGCVNFA